MLTLTFRRTHEFDTKDFDACRDKFNLFWKSLKRCKKLTTTDLRYVGAIEFQENGNVHFHILCHIPQVFKPLLVEKRKYGGLHYTNNKGSAEDASKIASYLSKGIHDERLPAGKKRYLGGYGLERPTTLQFKTRKVFDLLMQRNGKVLTTYESDYGFTVTSLLSDATIDELESFANIEGEDINLALLKKLQSIQCTQQSAI